MVSRINRRTILIPLFALLTLFVVGGCAQAPSALQTSSTKTVFFSTKDFRFYDLGFVKTYANHTDLEIFNAGVVLLQMKCYSNKICLNQECYAKDSIIRRFFGNDHFKELDFSALLNGHEIFSGENKQKLSDGFKQIIVRNGESLIYTSKSDSISLHMQTHTQKTIFQLEIHAN